MSKQVVCACNRSEKTRGYRIGSADWIGRDDMGGRDDRVGRDDRGGKNDRVGREDRVGRSRQSMEEEVSGSPE